MNLDRTLIGQIKDPILRKLFEHIARDGLNADDVKKLLNTTTTTTVVPSGGLPEEPPPDNPDQPHFEEP